MKLQFHRNLRQPQTVEASSLVIYDALDNPVVVAVEVENGLIIAETAANPAQFHALLRSLNISQTVIVHDTMQRSLPLIDIPGR